MKTIEISISVNLGVKKGFALKGEKSVELTEGFSFKELLEFIDGVDSIVKVAKKQHEKIACYVWADRVAHPENVIYFAGWAKVNENIVEWSTYQRNEDGTLGDRRTFTTGCKNVALSVIRGLENDVENS